MGRKTDINNDDDDDDKQRSSFNVSPMAASSTKRESQYNLHRDLDENKMNDDGNDLLIHDTILPHRKRIRKDTLQYIQSQQSTISSEILNVSFVFLFINNEKLN
jgi:hypothetical protein